MNNSILKDNSEGDYDPERFSNMDEQVTYFLDYHNIKIVDRYAIDTMVNNDDTFNSVCIKMIDLIFFVVNSNGLYIHRRNELAEIKRIMDYLISYRVNIPQQEYLTFEYYFSYYSLTGEVSIENYFFDQMKRLRDSDYLYLNNDQIKEYSLRLINHSRKKFKSDNLTTSQANGILDNVILYFSYMRNRQESLN